MLVEEKPQTVTVKILNDNLRFTVWRVEERRGCFAFGSAPFPFLAHQTERADFPRPAFQQISWRAHGDGLSVLEESRDAIARGSDLR
jgi:hypothetical protein